MRPGDCAREAETIRAAWDQAAGGEIEGDLAAHLASCPSCTEIALLARALREDRQAAAAEAAPPSSAVVWWRAQRRAREEAARRAERPIALIHAISLGCAAAAAAGLLSLGSAPLRAWLSSPGLGDAAWRMLLWRAGESWMIAWPAAAMLVLATSLILAPVAIYLALSEK